MGVVLPSVWTLVALLAGAGFTMWLEGRLLPRLATEMGPAAGVHRDKDIRPREMDPWLYGAAPVVAVLSAAWAMVVIPFGPGIVGSDLGVGLFYFLVAMDFTVLAVALGGWGADTPHSVEACYRTVAQLVAYVVPLGLAVLGPVMMARSLSTVSIVQAQVDAGLWYLWVQPLGFLLYIATSLMQVFRPPFLEPFADRLDSGVLGIYGGWKALFWRIGLSGVLFITAAMGAVLYLGGWSGPLLPAPIWMVLKTAGMLVLLLWAGTRVRLRSTAEMLELAWKILVPVGLLNVLIVGAVILGGVGQQPFR